MRKQIISLDLQNINWANKQACYYMHAQKKYGELKAVSLFAGALREIKLTF